MTKAEIITIGTEIILGQIMDTNTPYIAQNFFSKQIQMTKNSMLQTLRKTHLINALRLCIFKNEHK